MTMAGRPILVAPPEEFNGTIGEFVDEFVIPNLPSMDCLFEWTDAVLRYAIEDPDPILIVRGPQKGHLQLVGGARVVHSDNAPAIWCFLQCFDQAIDPRDVPKFIRAGEIPVLMALAANKRQKWNYGRSMSNVEKSRLWALGMKHCHILPVGRAGLSPRERFLRNLCPINHFLFASPKKYNMQRVGWSELRNVADLGESETVIAWIQQCLIHRLGNQSLAIYNRFFDLADGTRPNMASSKLRIRLVRHYQAEKIVRNSHLVYQPASVLSNAAPPNVVAKGNWTLNEKQGFYVRTGLKESVIDISLCYKTLNGDTTLIGKYVLDLESLSESGLVTRRVVERGIVYDVRIVREQGGSFWLRARNRVSLALEKLLRP